MILPDTSVWIDHLRNQNIQLHKLLEDEKILIHPFVIGEVALGQMKRYDLIISFLLQLPKAKVASASDVLLIIKERSLMGTGVGYVDAHLLASAKLTPNTLLWTRDKRLKLVAEEMEIASALT